MRSIDEAKALDALSKWVVGTIKDAPGLVLGISGTDSALAYLVCSRAMKLAGKDQNRLVGIHYGENFEFKEWFEQYGAIEVVKLPENNLLEEDVYRWAALQSYSLAKKFWVVGTRNRMEQTLGDYSNASAVAALQPISPLWKSEVFSLCEHLGVPKKLVDAGWRGDPQCECHRPCILRRLDPVEIVLSARAGEEDMQSVQKELFYDDVVEILGNFSREKAYKSKVPYLPPPNVLDDAIIK